VIGNREAMGTGFLTLLRFKVLFFRDSKPVPFMWKHRGRF
jgi:hypothetical protein